MKRTHIQYDLGSNGQQREIHFTHPNKHSDSQYVEPQKTNMQEWKTSRNDARQKELGILSRSDWLYELINAQIDGD